MISRRFGTLCQFHLQRLGVEYWVHYTQPLKMELTVGSETSVNHNMTPGKYPKQYIQYSKHGESLKSRIQRLLSHHVSWAIRPIPVMVRLVEVFRGQLDADMDAQHSTETSVTLYQWIGCNVSWNKYLRFFLYSQQPAVPPVWFIHYSFVVRRSFLLSLLVASFGVPKHTFTLDVHLQCASPASF
jgi:hypothetical protein